MKNSILLLVVFMLCAYSSRCQEIEVVKIDVDKDCSDHIGKRQFKGVLSTSNIQIVHDLVNKVQMGFSYYQNREVIYFTLNEFMFTHYQLDNFRLTIDGKDYNFDKMVQFQKLTNLNAVLDEVNSFAFGFEISPSTIESIKNGKVMTFSLVYSTNHQRKDWAFSVSSIRNTQETLTCFQNYYTPIKQEYINSLKDYEFDFRNSKWKDTKEVVLESEKSELILNSGDHLVYNVKLNSSNYTANFIFTNNQLHHGFYSFKDDFVNENNFYEHYKQTVKLLESKYGSPKTVNKHRKGNLFDDIDDIGLAIETGQYSESTVWETKDSFITIIITGENYKVDILISYETKDQQLLIESQKIKKENQLDGF